MIAGFLARGLPAGDSAAAAAYLHGLAGQLAGRKAAEGTTAGDVLAHVVGALEEVRGR
jgi:NAD(P)H-hydrate epimerase